MGKKGRKGKGCRCYPIGGKDEEAGGGRRGHGCAVPLQPRVIDCAYGLLGFLLGFGDARFQSAYGEVGLLFVD